MKEILNNIMLSSKLKKPLLAILIDPDKFNIKNTSQFIDKAHKSRATHIFVGGSTVKKNETQELVLVLKKHTQLPVVLFPGDVSQLAKTADALLYLVLVSGRNPEYLIEQQIKSVPFLRSTALEVIPTGYILIDGKKHTATQKVTNTKPLNSVSEIVDTAKASEYLGYKLIYLEAGSGAKQEVSANIIKAVKKDVNLPLIVGGGIRNKKQLETAYNAGADLVVIGTAFEEDESFFNDLSKNLV